MIKGLKLVCKNLRLHALQLFRGTDAVQLRANEIAVTERKAIEDRLRFQAQVLDSMSEAVVVTDLMGVILYWGKGSESLYGYQAEEVVGKDYRAFAGSVEKSDEEAFRKMVLAQNGWHGEHRQRRRDGTEFWSEVHIYILHDAKGHACGFIGLDHDITHRKEAEEKHALLQKQFAQAQRMESLSRLAGGIAHDFNNMLGVIMANTEMLVERMQPVPESAENLHHIAEASKRAASLTRHLLAFACKQTAAPRAMFLNRVVGDSLKMLRRLLGANIRLRWVPAADEAEIWFDPEQAEQILSNLCINANDAMGEKGGILQVRTERVAVGADMVSVPPRSPKPGTYMLLAVADSGCGMVPEVYARLFEPFFTTKPFDQGTGLGLSAVYGIVNQNGGFIQVDTEPGKGSEFRVYIPIREESACASGMYAAEPNRRLEQASVEPARCDALRILLVEDEPSVLYSIQLFLERMNHTVLSAATPQKAIDLARAYGNEIDLMLTDIVMPKMNGYELSAEIKRIIPSVRCMFMSGYTADIMTQDGFLDDGVVFLGKPFTQAELRRKLNEAMVS